MLLCLARCDPAFSRLVVFIGLNITARQ